MTKERAEEILLEAGKQPSEVAYYINDSTVEFHLLKDRGELLHDFHNYWSAQEELEDLKYFADPDPRDGHDFYSEEDDE